MEMQSGKAPMLKVANLHAGYAGKEIVHGLDMEVYEGEFVCILGANGCGKSTTLKTLLGLLRPLSGQILMDGRDTVRMREAQRAKLFAYIPQAHTPPFPFTVLDVVTMGRTPHIGHISKATKEDEAIAWGNIELLGLEDIADQPYTQLSGGQQQLVLIARAMTQQPRLLVMDEPTASLDFGNQQLVLRRLRKLTETGVGVLMVTHDPTHALLCAQRVVVMEKGCVLLQAPTSEAVTSDVLQRVYGADIEVSEVPTSKGRQLVCVQMP